MKIDYAVFGNPVAHSKSPFIHAQFAAAVKLGVNYGKQLVAIGEFATAADEFFKNGGQGLNVTVPFKEEAYRYVDVLAPSAKLAQAVNTIVYRRGTTTGHNTDGSGLLRDLTQNLKLEITDKNLLILGAGGAARGVLEPLLAQQPAKLHIANRTVEKASELRRHALGLNRAKFCQILASGYKNVASVEFDLLINATSLSLQNKTPPVSEVKLAANGAVYDMFYAAEPTAFMRWGLQNKAALVADGLGMLLEQAADAFYLWHGVMPQTQALLPKLRAEL